MIWWYNTVFLNRAHSNSAFQTLERKHLVIKAPRTGIIEKLRTSFKDYRETRFAKAKFNESIEILSKLSQSQLEDVGLVPADLIALKNGERKVARITDKQVQNRRCEVCYLPNMSERNPEANCGIAAEYCGIVKAA